jgi:carotenoid cleavage dioxygenase-like enzyme
MAQYCAELAITALYKQDYQTGGCETAPLDAGLVIGEMPFVPNPGAGSEDDGILMGTDTTAASTRGSC